ncbi:MAG: protein kinase [Pirellulales bacterium]|nr:protein kinase [Pirellulales bacterium]
MTGEGASCAHAPAGCSGDAALESLLDEIADRLQAGEYVDADQYAAAHPRFAERLRNILPAMRLLAACGGHSAVERAEGAAAAAADGAGVLGDFRLVREIGRGGMGVVYEAVQVSLRRRVALKVLPFAAILDERQLTRFKNEARAAALVHHTNIVPVFSVGCERGVHYYAMQFIEGRSLAEIVPRETVGKSGERKGESGERRAERGEGRFEFGGGELGAPATISGQSTEATQSLAALSTLADGRSRAYVRRVAGLGIQAAEALEHAHRHGVLHRDIKPANMMLDGAGNLWITDFGLARLEADAGMTMTGDLVGTLRYMSPEQAGVIADKVDHRTDVYSLGVTLYELLVRRPAVGGDSRREIFRRIAEEELPSLVRINRFVPRELETIILKAAARRPADRYETAQELADDLRRFLDDKPIAARRASLAHRAGKWLRRHRSLAAITAAALVFSGAVLAANVQWRAAQERQRRGEVARRQREETLVAQRQMQRFAYSVDLRNIEELKLCRDAEAVKLALAKYRPTASGEDLRGFEWHYFSNLLNALEGKQQRSVAAHARQIYCLALSHDETLLASCSEDAQAKIWEYPSLELRHTLAGYQNDVNWAAFSPDDRTLATCSDDGTVRLWDVATGEKRLQFPAHATWAAGGGEQIATGIGYSPDGQTLATMSRSEVRLWDASTGAALGTLPGRGLACAAAHRVVATMPDKSAIALWDIDSKEQVGSLPLGANHATELNMAQFNSNDTALVAAGEDGSLVRWGLAWHGAAAVVRSRGAVWTGPAAVETVRTSRDGLRAATASRDGGVNVWDLRSVPFQRVGGPYIHSDRAWTALFSRDGQSILTSGMDGKITSWAAQSDQFAAAVYATPAYQALSGGFSEDGEQFLMLVPRAAWRDEGGEGLHVLGLAGSAQAPWRAITRRPARRQPGEGHDTAAQYYVDALAVSRWGREAAVSGGGGVFLWDGRDSQKPLRQVIGWEDAGPPTSPDRMAHGSAAYLNERTLAVLRAGVINIVDLVQGAVVERLAPPRSERVSSFALSQDGQRLAVGGEGGSFWTYDLGRRRWAGGGRAARGAILCLEFLSPAGLLALGSKEAMVVIWDLNTGRLRHQLIGHRGPVTALAWAAGAKRLASAGVKDGGAVRLWDIEVGQQVCQLNTEPQCDLYDVAFARNGQALAACGVSGGRAGAVYRWRIEEESSRVFEKRSGVSAREERSQGADVLGL